MLKSVWDDVVHYFKNGNMIARIILVNIAIFIGVNLLSVFMNVGSGMSLNPSMNQFLNFFSVPSSFKELLFHPWSIFTTIFLHQSFGHIFWNMVLLYSFGRIAGDLLSDKRMLPIYILGGMAGALSFVVSSEILRLISPAYNVGYSMGASGAVMAITVAAGVTAPEYRVNLLLFSTKLKYVVLALVFMDVIGASAINVGKTDYFAHLGGAFFGWLFVYLLRRGKDLSVPLNRIFDRISAILNGRFQELEPKRPKPKVAYKNPEKIQKMRERISSSMGGSSTSLKPERKTDYSSIQERVDDILDKINRKGIEGLSAEELDFLNKFRNKLD